MGQGNYNVTDSGCHVVEEKVVVVLYRKWDCCWKKNGNEKKILQIFNQVVGVVRNGARENMEGMLQARCVSSACPSFISKNASSSCRKGKPIMDK